MTSNDSKVRVIVHRGSKQIGGCCTEISYKGTCIAIDFGSPLPGMDSKKLDIEGLTIGKSRFAAVLFTHYHGDHVGEAGRINSDISIYMSGFTKDIISAYKEHNQHNFSDINPDTILEFTSGEELSIGEFKILPILSDHSAADSYMFLIKAGNFTILHTGDFRLHGRYKEKLLNNLKEIGKLDLLITEGTTLSRKEKEEENYTEELVEEKIKDLIYKNKYCFIILSSTNFDRLWGIKKIINQFRSDNSYKGKYFLIDRFQQSLFEIADKRLPERYRFGREVTFRKDLLEKIDEKGFIMLLRMSNPEHEEIFRRYISADSKDSCLIYSMWSGYMEGGKLKEWTEYAHERGKLRIVHSSGHVTKQDLVGFVNILKPKQIIVIHTEEDENCNEIINKIPINDGDIIEFDTI